ncbi:MAG TPA: hypothetical protein VFD94_03315 [Jatrophihabitans sp.]|nr:hypothetical protein [Jatrophihabitans sp.]
MTQPPRMAAVWCPDWPVVTACAGTSLTMADPVAVTISRRCASRP